MKTRIVIADDHPLISAATKAIVEQFDDFEVLYEVENGQVFIDKIKDGFPTPDIIILDLSMPLMNGKETTEWIQEHFPHIKVLINSVNVDLKTFIELFEAGALGYTIKNAKPKQLLNNLLAIKNNQFIYPYGAEKIIQSLYPFSTIAKKIITEEEKIFLQLFCKYYSIEQIAQIKNISISKVKQYENILKVKLNVRHRNQLLYFAQLNQLL